MAPPCACLTVSDVAHYNLNLKGLKKALEGLKKPLKGFNTPPAYSPAIVHALSTFQGWGCGPPRWPATPPKRAADDK